MPAPSDATRRAPAGFLLGAVLVALFRGALVWLAPDAIHPVDPAELEILQLARLLASGDASAVLHHLGRASVVHHGGTLFVAATTALCGALVGLGYPALKLSALLWSLAGWVAWVLVALRQGGPRAALLLGVALALPVPWATQWWLTAWGSHPEATLFPALWLLARRPGATGLLVGAGVGFAPLLWPTGLVVLVARLRGRGVLVGAGAALLGWAPTQLGALATAAPWWSASLREDPAFTLGGLLGRALDGGTFLVSVTDLLPLPLVASEAVGAPTLALSYLLTLGLVLAGLGVLAGRSPDAGTDRLLVVCLLVHVLTLILLSPTRPALAHRYLLPWLPGLLLLPALLAGRAKGWPALLAGALVLAPSFFALPVYGALFTRNAPADLSDWRPDAWLSVGLDRVPVELAPGVNAWLDSRGAAATEGLAAAWTRRWTYPVLGEPFPPVQPRAGLAGRLRALAESGEDPAALARDAGVGLGLLVEPEAAAPFLVGVEPVDAVQAGLAEGRALRSPP